ncbi:MAG: hypothetical protein IJR08_01715 [Bacilli bacterium]|nr:hypothetical protein [Bacilli bacterium]
MKNFFVKHLTKIVVIGIAFVSLTIAGVNFLVSRVQYNNYLVQYEKNAEEIRASFPALPEEVLFDNEYIAYDEAGEKVASSKSEYKNSLILYARDASVAPLSTDKAQEYKKMDGDDSKLAEYITGLDRMGGAITFTIKTESYGLSDIEIGLRNNWRNNAGVYQEIENLTDKIKIQVNKLELKTEKLSLSTDRDGFQSLIFKDTFLIRGENTITLTTSAYNDTDSKNDCLYIMPDIRNLTVISDVDFAQPE